MMIVILTCIRIMNIRFMKLNITAPKRRLLLKVEALSSKALRGAYYLCLWEEAYTSREAEESVSYGKRRRIMTGRGVFILWASFSSLDSSLIHVTEFIILSFFIFYLFPWNVSYEKQSTSPPTYFGKENEKKITFHLKISNFIYFLR